MTTTTPARRVPVAARRAGYVITALVDAGLLWAVNVWPGWQAVPLLTEDTTQVLGLVNLSLAAGLIANLLYLVDDAPWVRSLGDLVTTGIGLVVLVRIWQVFPFAFHDAWLNLSQWSSLVRFVLVVAIVGSVIGVIVQAVSLVRRVVEGAAGGGGENPSRGGGGQ